MKAISTRPPTGKTARHKAPKHIRDLRAWLNRQIEKSQQPKQVAKPKTPAAQLDWWMRSYLPSRDEQRPGEPLKILADAALAELTAARQLLDSLATRPLDFDRWRELAEHLRTRKRGGKSKIQLFNDSKPSLNSDEDSGDE
jgi:hypothetical protein